MQRVQLCMHNTSHSSSLYCDDCRVSLHNNYIVTKSIALYIAMIKMQLKTQHNRTVIVLQLIRHQIGRCHSKMICTLDHKR